MIDHTLALCRVTAHTSTRSYTTPADERTGYARESCVIMKAVIWENEGATLLEILKNINLALAFLLELCMLAALSYWGFTLDQGLAIRFGAGLGVPILVAVIWGMWMAPRASNRLPEPLHLIVELIIFGLAIAALYAAGRPQLALAFWLVYVLNVVLRYVWGQ